MKKRTIIAILITVVMLFVTNKTWLSYTPMSVSFDIKGNDTVTVDVELNKKDDAEFRKVKSETINLNITNPAKANVSINRAKSPKRFRMVVSEIKDQTLISVSNIQFQDGQYRLDNLEKMELEGATLIKKNKNEVVFRPEQVIVKLTYPDTLNVKAKVNFDIQLFIILTILTFLLTYKLSNYIAEFKTIQGKSRIDILFLTVFFVCLFIPMLRINNDNVSMKENRVLAKWIPFINNKQINYSFGNNFNDWYNDRFFLRPSFINIYNEINTKLTHKTKLGFYDPKNGFMYVGNSHAGMDELIQNFNALYEFNDFCKKRNIKLYVLIVPNKEDIYPSDLFSENDSGLYEKSIDYIKKTAPSKNLNVIYPYQELLDAKNNDFMYFKTEHHWTDGGAFVAYKALMSYITKDFPKVKALTEKDFNYSYNKLVRGDFDRKYHFGSTSVLMNLTDLAKYHDVDYKYYTHKDYNNLKQEWINKDMQAQKNYYYPKGADLRVIQLGTSHNENLTEFIPFTFKNVKRIRNNDVKGMPAGDEFKIMKYYEKTMLEYKPDIIIFCIAYTNIAGLSDIFNKE